MARYVEAPEQYWWDLPKKEKSIFMAGGITGCPDWQKEMRSLLEDTSLILINPRRENFPIHDPNAAEEQITWEFEHLRRADCIMFWFSKETLCPIVLYELGSWANMPKDIFVGVHPEYSRRKDVEIQMSLARPRIQIVYSIEDLANQIKEGIKCAV